MAPSTGSGGLCNPSGRLAWTNTVPPSLGFKLLDERAGGNRIDGHSGNISEMVEPGETRDIAAEQSGLGSLWLNLQ